MSWEAGKTHPFARWYPAIVRYLGYDPFGTGPSLGERIRTARHRRGLSQQELAAFLGVAKSTIGRWETGRLARQSLHLVELLERFVAEE